MLIIIKVINQISNFSTFFIKFDNFSDKPKKVMKINYYHTKITPKNFYFITIYLILNVNLILYNLVFAKTQFYKFYVIQDFFYISLTMF